MRAAESRRRASEKEAAMNTNIKWHRSQTDRPSIGHSSFWYRENVDLISGPRFLNVYRVRVY
jgi:hypothetical protein